jgi:hypothetical protein
MKREARLTKRERKVTQSSGSELSTIAGMERSAAGFRRMADALKSASPEGKREARKVFLASARELRAAADELVRALESE